jgi:RES domain-containing protein
MGIAAAGMPVVRPLYRARRAKDLPTPWIMDFAPPPREKVSEGRYNHGGHSMLYLAELEATALAEIASPDEACHVAAIDFDIELKLLDLNLSDEVEGEAKEVIQCLARSALCAAPRSGQGWDRKEYVFTRFVADCARHAGFDAIRYGSTRDKAGINLVLLDPSEDLMARAKLRSLRTVPNVVS